jgi:diguanylate cyclase (GGDEF)-like protein
MFLQRRKHAARRHWRLSAKLLIASSVATVIGFSAICASVMLDMRRGEEQLARQMLENLAAGIDADIGRNIEIYDLSLRAVASNMVLPEIRHVSREIRHLILFDHAAMAKHFGAIQVFDATGQLTADASSLDPRPENRADEEYFQIHRDNPDAGLFISKPMLHRGAYSIVLSRRISGEDNAFLGVVAGSIRFSYFHELFERLKLDSDDSITVLRRDRTIIMRKPFDLDYIGKNLATIAGWSANNLKPGGSFAGKGPIDPIPRLFVRRDGAGPLDVVVGKPLDAVFRLWHKEAMRVAAIMVVLVLFVLGITLFLAREIGRRAAAEAKLEELAITDALTGLRNRRKFDDEIDSEWRRAVRQKAPLALLMIDADHFKAYNDTHGHQAGDRFLKQMAGAWSQTLRAGDIIARYGGEEFAVALPGTNLEHAQQMLERMRACLPEGQTCSAGVCRWDGAESAESLTARADTALYAAKDAGRDRVVGV